MNQARGVLLRTLVLAAVLAAAVWWLPPAGADQVLPALTRIAALAKPFA